MSHVAAHRCALLPTCGYAGHSFRLCRKSLPVPTSGNTLAELPALAHHLEQREIPEEFRDPCGRGILAWRDPELMAAFDNTKPERQLAEIIEICIQRAPHLWQDLPAELTAIQIKTRLEDRDSPVREQAKDLLRWGNACGTYLSRLVDDESCAIISAGTPDTHAKRKRYRVTRAQGAR